MKAKQFNAIVLITVLFASMGFSATTGTWYGAPAGDANHAAGTGKWTDAYWNKPPVKLAAPPGNPDEQIKIGKPNMVCTVDSNIGNYQYKLNITGGTDAVTAAKLEIVKGGNIGLGELRVGAGGAASTGGAGCINQTGGTLNLGDRLIIGRMGTSETNPNNGKGFYTISGGTLTYLPTNTNATLYLGANGAGEGTFTIAGKAANISLKKLYVGGDGKKPGGIGTVEFKIDANGVSPIRLEDGVFLDPAGEGSTAKLAVSTIGAPPKSDILLVETIGGNPVTGIFDTVNGKPAAEGAEVVVNQGGNNYYYKLTYTGGAGANDIMLKFSRVAAAAPAAK